MRRFPAFIVFLLLLNHSNDLKANPELPLKPGMVIRSSVTIIRQQYFLNAPDSLLTPLVQIEGSNITVDFNDAVLQGSNDRQLPNGFYGLAILVKKGSRHITIRHARIHGFKVAVLADSVENLSITDCDIRYNWRDRLYSGREQEDERDWMSYHHNENDEWLRYGAAIYLKHCNKAVVHNNIATNGQCALMMTGCSSCTVSDNNFSFNSGIGIGLYRSSNNKMYNNRLDWNVRGYSHGKYHRGQDSAGILVFEQSSSNIFAFNSATHSGDGFFLWAGQTTMDTGTGGCNDNFIYGNDFSYAPTNGIEITFSRNLVMHNKISGCDHGVWGGYSFDTDITDNDFSDNRIGIAIEHGQGINIAMNRFRHDATGIRLWARESQPADWKYPQLRNTNSMNYWIAANRFIGNIAAVDLKHTDTVAFSGNRYEEAQVWLKVANDCNAIDTLRNQELLELEYQEDARLKQVKHQQLPDLLFPQGRNQIRITEWGPYNFAYPLLWLTSIDTAGLYHFEILGPIKSEKSGAPLWQPETVAGFDIIEKGAAVFPSTLVAKPIAGDGEHLIRLRYNGDDFFDVFGKKISGINHLFGYRHMGADLRRF
jgi:parallel beta-helix repeat protein